MTTICTNTPFPKFQDLIAGVTFTWPPTIPTLPPMPSIPSPMLPGISMPSLEIVNIIQQLQVYQLLATVGILFDKILGKLGLALDAVIPAIPEINIKLPDLLALDAQPIIDAIKAKLALNITFGFPSPLLPGMSIPSLEAVQISKYLTIEYIPALLDILVGKISDVLDLLRISGSLSIPTVPTLAELKAMLLASLPDFPDLNAAYASLGLNGLFAGLSIPGFPAMPAFPDPLIPTMSSFSIDINEALAIYLANLTTVPIDMIVGFVLSKLSMLGFSFPPICFTF